MAKYACDVPRLSSAKKKSRMALKRFREERREAVRDFIGAHWSDEGSRQLQPINLLALYISIVGRQLVAKNPRVMLSTFERAHKPTVKAMEQWTNEQIERMKLDTVFQRIVLDAIFSIGIAKVGLCSVSDSATSGWVVKAGMPFCDRIDIDDFVYDTRSHNLFEASFIGHRFRAPLEVVKEDKSYNAKRKDVVATDDGSYNQEGDERIGQLGRGYDGISEDYEDWVELWEYYLPRHKVIVTLDDNDDLLGERDWIGPELGPYTYCGYGWVPGNAMPTAPMQNLVDMNRFINAVYRKLMRQTLRQKSVLPVRSEEDVQRLAGTGDGQGFMCAGQDPKELNYGGPNQINLAMFLQAKQIFSFLADNMDLIGGAGAQSPTATQDKLLNENAHATIADKQKTTIDFVGDTLTNLMWYFHHDPYTVQKSVYALKGLPHIATARVTRPEQRAQIPWEDLKIKVDPYSMQATTPRRRLADLNQVVQTIILPMLPMMQQQGRGFDIDVYLEKVGKYLDEPDIMEIVNIQETPDVQEQGAGEQMGMPANTSRTYERVSRSERSQAGNERALMHTLAGGNPGGNPEGNGQLLKMMGA